MANGAYAGKVVCAAAAVVQVPASLDLGDAAALPTGALTGTQLIEEAIAPSAGMKGIVLGAGGSTGRAAVFAALDAGVEVYAGVRSTSRHSCDDLPVAGVIDLADDAALARAAPFDFVADTVGGPTAEKLFAHLKPAGVFASIAVPPPNPPANSTQRFTSHIVHFDGPRLARFARDLLIRGRQMPIARRVPLAEVARAHEVMERGGVNGKILLIP
jgi:NADPH2:quinone reductase